MCAEYYEDQLTPMDNDKNNMQLAASSLTSSSSSSSLDSDADDDDVTIRPTSGWQEFLDPSPDSDDIDDDVDGDVDQIDGAGFNAVDGGLEPNRKRYVHAS